MALLAAALSAGDLPWLAGAIAPGGVLGPVLLMFGFLLIPASTASLLLDLEGAFTSLVAGAVFREHVPSRIALGIAAICWWRGALLGGSPGLGQRWWPAGRSRRLPLLPLTTT